MRLRRRRGGDGGTSDERRWIDVDVTSAVEQWLRKPRRQLGGLQVHVVTGGRGRRGRRRNYDTLSLLDGHDCCAATQNTGKQS